MHRPIFGLSFAVLVAPILLFVLLFKFLNKKKTNERKKAEDADPSASGSTTARTESESSGSSSSPTETSDGPSTRNRYEVFLSFRGPDTRNNFTDHLYHRLRDAGIHTFRDDEELRQGEEIGPDLLAAIKNSQILIPILSVNYGESKWCLEELVQIMECKKNNTGHIVLPVFYKVAPADVRHQRGSFGKAFNKRESSERRRGSDSTILEKWKQALRDVGDLKGREANGPEAELVKSVVQQVLLELKKKFELVTPENLVGIDSHVAMVLNFVDGNSGDPLFVGIHGMGGIGKTTLAKTIYNKLSNQFEHHSFIPDVRESCKSKGIPHLQNQLISNILNPSYRVHTIDEGIRFLSSKLGGKKVLILLDDVDDIEQLKALAGNHNWFSLGSVIIITTRVQDILDRANVDYQHEHEELKKDDSLTLFSRHAFRGDRPPSEFKELTDEVLHYTGGSPLSLEVLGSFLCGKKEKIWKDTAKKLRKGPHHIVQKLLRISYEALTREQKQIFLDIACFFIGFDKTTVSYMWDGCDYFLEEGIEVLIFLSLIKVEVRREFLECHDKYELKMHDQLRDLGRAIVYEENKMEPGECSRLWDSEEALKTLEENEGTRKDEAIRLGEYSSSFEPFIFTSEQFKELRNLRFHEARGAHFSGDFNNSFRKLKWLRWQECPSTFVASNFRTEELALLDLAASKISDNWRGWSFITMAKELKFLDLTGCYYLKKTSFLSAFEKLEVLILRDCSNIKQIDSSIGKMKSLVRLDLGGCCCLEGLPVEVGKLEALKHLFLRFSSIRQLPDSIGNLQNLEALDISETKIGELPNDIGRLRKLRELDAMGCWRLRETPESIRNLSSLQRLDLRRCWNLRSVSVLPSSLKSLLVTCESLRFEVLSNQTHLECIGEPSSIPSEEYLNTASELEILDLFHCDRLKILDVSQHNHLRRLSLIGCSNVKEIRISGCRSIERLDLTYSKDLKELHVGSCENLSKIQGLDKLKYLKLFDMSGCTSFGSFPDLCCFDTLHTLAINYGDSLHNIQSLGRFPSCKSLWIEDYKSLAKFLNLSNFCNLQTLVLSRFHELQEISGLEKSTSLKNMAILGCSSIEILPDLSSCTNMVCLVVQDCEKLTELRGLEKLEQLTELDISGCKSLKTIPELPRAKIYQNYELRRWKSDDDAMTVLGQFDEVEDEDDYEEEDDEDEDVDDDEDEYEEEDDEDEYEDEDEE